MMEKTTDKLYSQLENRRRNLVAIEQTIEADKNSGYKLVPVKDFLSQRIESLEQELKRN
jgi:hypothetical protein